MCMPWADRSSVGYSELHYAIVSADEGLISDLLRGHSDPNLASMSGLTVNAFALRHGKPALAVFMDEVSKTASVDPNSTAVFQPNAVSLKCESSIF